ncbi:heme-binding protein [Novosphingobium sp.]|uniref:heme-binding protein n=1 Tax=Novosphingobium sp. TaxID=1874826 RepID=UPI003B51B419
MTELLQGVSKWERGRAQSHLDGDVRQDTRLGLLGELKGTWVNDEGFERRMWNMIALPFGPEEKFPFRYRLLLNQGLERLRFSLGDLGVPNRGDGGDDQHVAALMYLQEIDQLKAVDAATNAAGLVDVATPDVNDTPKGSTLAPGDGVISPEKVGIHAETGIFFNLSGRLGACDNIDGPGPNLGRMASIPHGDAVLAMGFDSPVTHAPPDFKDPGLRSLFDGLPIGLEANEPVTKDYLAPYQKFIDSPFLGVETKLGFPGFSPADPLHLLDGAIERVLADPTGPFAGKGGKITEMKTIIVDSDVMGNVTNIPFVGCQANATKVNSIFWIQKIEFDDGAAPRFVLQYAQRVMLEFHPRTDGTPGLIRWPHITINTLIRAVDPDEPGGVTRT